jgi:hypothetical protein
MSFNLETYFYINQHSLSKEICNDIINYFEAETDTYQGVTGAGLNKDIKDTLDFQIPNKNENTSSRWSKIRTLLEKELNNNVKKYVKCINDSVSIEEEESHHKYKVFNKYVSFETLQIQKYQKSKGRYIYHNDFSTDWKEKKYRVITFLWYLNTIEEGGETEFWNTYKVKPETGKLLLFPATWTYPHRGMMPISDNKYIITGWLYLNE